MASSRTINRKRRLAMVREWFIMSLDLLVLEHQEREAAKMSEFKEISRNLKKVWQKCNSKQKRGLKILAIE